jgi:hypothetical protein
MSLKQRLARCITYRDEAMKQPEENKLYIEDLNLSIALFQAAKTSKPEYKAFNNSFTMKGQGR